MIDATSSVLQIPASMRRASESSGDKKPWVNESALFITANALDSSVNNVSAIPARSSFSGSISGVGNKYFAVSPS